MPPVAASRLSRPLARTFQVRDTACTGVFDSVRPLRTAPAGSVSRPVEDAGMGGGL